MNDRDILLANILNAPADDTARLVLADWLQEHGEEAFGRFLHAGVIASHFNEEQYIDDLAYYSALTEIAAVAKTGEPARWIALVLGPRPLTASDWSWDNTGDRVTVRVGQSAGIFVRGLLTELEVTLDDWYTIAALAFTAWPIAHVRALDVPGLSFTIEQLKENWRFTGRLQLPRQNVPLTQQVIPSAYSPGPVLTHDSDEWFADQLFSNRTALVEGITTESAAIVDDLRDALGDRWPRPRRRRK